MNNLEVLKTIREIVMDVLDIEERVSFILTEDSQIEDYDKWDSLAHINIITQLEETFSVSFTLDEIEAFDNVKIITNTILTKM